MTPEPQPAVSDFDRELSRRLDAIREQGLWRELRRVDSPQITRIQINGRAFINFSSNDYLGLANHPALKEAAIKAIERFGAGSGASRLICGSLAPHHDLEEALAAFKQTEAALTFSSGYATALGAICALLEKDDLIVMDKLVHASIVDAARLCGAKLRVFAHNDLNDLEDILKWAEGRTRSAERGTRNRAARTLIVTESIFSMDGDRAPLRELVNLKDKYGAWLMVDEAHATGIIGANGRGVADELGVSKRIEIQMGTLGKALGASGGFICGSRPLADCLINRARSFIFSTAPVPAAVAAARVAVELVQSSEGEQRRKTLGQLVKRVHSELKTQDSRPRTQDSGFSSAILPVWIGDETKAVETAARLRESGLFVPAIRYPTVARGKARLRVTVTAGHTPEDLTQLTRALETRDPRLKTH